MPNLHAPSVIAPSEADFYRLIGERAPAMLAVFSADERFLFANDAYAEPFGREASGLLGGSVREVFGEDGYAEISPQLHKALAGERVSYVRQPATLKDSTARLLSKMQPVFDATGAVVYVLVGETVLSATDEA